MSEPASEPTRTGLAAATPDLAALEDDARARLAAVATPDGLRALEADLLGKRSALALLKAGLRDLAPEERKDRGQALNGVRGRVEAAVAARRGDLEAEARRRRLEDERLDLTEVVARHPQGHLHLVTTARDSLEDVFVGMGYTVAEGPEVETDWNNFEALNMPPAHPARSMYDTFYVDLGEPESTLLRTHTSPVQIRLMEATEPPLYAVVPGRCYRVDTPDASHLPVFHQIEGLVVDEGITFGDLAGTLDAFTEAYFGSGITTRLRPSYFPFTEPSAEFDITCTVCKGGGCRTCKQTGWLELGGCGMVHPHVLANVGIDPERWTGFAFGFGYDRMAQMRHGVDDLRQLVTNDIRFLEQF